MCDTCDKTNFLIETVEALYDDKSMMEHLKSIGMDKYINLSQPENAHQLATGARISLMMMAVTEMAYQNKFSKGYLEEGIQLCIQRIAMRGILEKILGKIPDHQSYDDLRNKLMDDEGGKNGT